jgi:hypothetical protein
MKPRQMTTDEIWLLVGFVIFVIIALYGLLRGGRGR